MSKKRQYRSTKKKKTNNVLLFKLVDPICQSLLFIFFIYSLDTDYMNNGGIPYRTILFSLLFLQVVSMVVNFFVKEENQLKTERIAYLVTMVLFLASFFIIQKKVSEKFIEVFSGSATVQMPLIEIILMAVGVVIAFWYFTICFREIRGLMKSDNDD